MAATQREEKTAMVSCLCGCAPRLGRRGLIASAFAISAFSVSSIAAEPAPAADPALIDDIVTANHILYDQAVVDGFGHVSARHDKDPNRYLLSRSMAPALVTPADIMEFDLDSNPIDARGRTPYLERFIHGEIYKVRPDVMAIVHSHSPGVLPFADTNVRLLPMNHIAGFLGEGPPVFEIRATAGPETDMLVRNNAIGKALAESLGANAIALMRGHGSVAAAQSVKHVVFRAIYTEVNARAEAEALKIGVPTFLNAKEAAAATKTNDALVERPWALWKQRVASK
jgi:HCOMODA/2-hydroxy-3-carboxy-muconic semialdehyde decarboxylase